MNERSYVRARERRGVSHSRKHSNTHHGAIGERRSNTISRKLSGPLNTAFNNAHFGNFPDKYDTTTSRNMYLPAQKARILPMFEASMETIEPMRTPNMAPADIPNLIAKRL